MRRRLAVLAAALVALSVLSPAAFASDASAAEHEIDSCTVIDEPGEYEVVEDVRTDQEGSCIEIEAENVTIDGTGHTIAGPGAGGNGTGIDVDSEARNVAIQNLVIESWETGVYAGGNYELTNAVVRDSETGLRHSQGGAEHLGNVTIEHNDIGISSQMGGAEGTDVTVRENGMGIFGMDGGSYDLTDAEIVDNEGYGVSIEHSSYLTLEDSTVSGNDGHGVFFPYPGYPVGGSIENTTISGNGGDGVRVVSVTDEPVELVGVTVADNGGTEVNAAASNSYTSGGTESDGRITATDLTVGSSARTAFEDEAIRLEPVDRDDLPDREGGTVVGDALNVSGNVTDAVDLELDVDTDHESLDLWRHDGDGWETVEEDLDASDATAEATVDSTGTYAPGTETDDQDDSDDQDEGDDSDDSTDDDPDDSEDDGSADEPSDQDGDKKKHTPTPTPSDKDGDKGEDTETPTETDSDGSSSGGSSSGSSGSSGSSSTATDTPTATSTPTDTGTATPAEEATESPDSDQQQDDEDATATDDAVDGDEATDDDDAVLADGAGFTPAAALVALLASALLIRRRQ